MKYSVHLLSDTGRVRQLNEDSVRVERPTDPTIAEKWGDLYVVADGMGGHESGEVASRIAIETIFSRYYAIEGKDPGEALAQAIEEANAEVFRRAQEEDRHGMGTTVVAASRVDNHLYVAHVGDSRMYLIRDNKIMPLTQDHSMVAEQVAAGLITEAEAERHPYRNVISRAVGTSPQVEVEVSHVTPLELEEGDVVLLCSDGLTEHVKAPQIRQLIANRTPETAAAALIKAANNGGGSDNITVILLRVGEIKGDGETTAVMTVGDAITEPNPVLATPEEIAAKQAAATLVSEEGAPRRNWGCLLGSVLFLLLVGSGAYVFFNPSLIAGFLPPPAPTAAPTPDSIVSTPTVATSPAATAPAAATPDGGSPSPNVTSPAVATTAPLPTQEATGTGETLTPLGTATPRRPAPTRTLLPTIPAPEGQ